MSYRIEKGESLAGAFGRIASEEISIALAELRRRSHGEAVHNARKALKRLRGLLRSLRIALPKELYERENRRFAAAGRRIAPWRDIHVQLRTLVKLGAHTHPAGKKIRADLLRQRKTISRQSPGLRKIVREMLHASEQAIADWPLQKATPARLAAGLKKVFKQGRAAHRAALHRPSPVNLHEWRKKVKSLGFGFELIQGLGSKKFAKTIERCEDLGDCLGDDHDLFMALAALRREHATQPSDDFGNLAHRVAARRTKLQRRAFRLGRRLYAEKPSVFEKRLDKFLARAAKSS